MTYSLAEPQQRQRLLDRVRYRVGHEALAGVFGLGTGLWHRVLNPGEQRPDPALLGALRRRFQALMSEDLANAEAGLYPRELLLQSPIDLRTVPEALLEYPRILRRQRQARFGDLPPEVDERYPAYYRRNFHWQTDGWFSAHSARVYDFQVEFLFFGTMEVMRRMALPPLVHAARDQANTPGGSPFRLLDVACGTGRLLRQMRVALPGAQLFGVDLSPHYLQRAQTTCAELADIRFLSANAEALPLADASFDAVSCGYLFHELPHDARRQVARELLRVLKPGGTLVLEDSMQAEDPNGQELGYLLEWFPRAYHEPYYKGYVQDPLGALVAEVGFRVERQSFPLLSKLVVAQRPAAG